MTQKRIWIESGDPLVRLLDVDPDIPLARIVAILRANKPSLYRDRPSPEPCQVPPGESKVPIMVDRYEKKKSLFHENDPQPNES